MKVQRKKRKNYGKHRHATHSTSRIRPVVSTLGMLLLVGGLVIAGYMLADTLHNQFTTEEPPVESSAAVNSTAEDTEPAGSDTTTTSATTVTTETTTVTTTAPPAPVAANAADFTGQYVSADALESIETLDAALSGFSSGDTVILPLKTEGGVLLYASELKTAKECGAVQSTLTLAEISDCLRKYELTAIISLSLLNDNLYPAYDHTAGYYFSDGYTRWLDDKQEEGGKPWLSPFSDSAVAYLQSIVSELNEAGFLHILCEDVSFPDFYASDLEHIGEKVKSKTARSEALIHLLNAMQKTAQQSGGSVMMEFSLYSAMNRDVEYLTPILLDVPNAVILIDIHSFRDTLWYGNEQIALSGKSVTEILETVLPIANEMTGEVAVIPCLKLSSLTDEEETEALATLASMGYSRYCVK